MPEFSFHLFPNERFMDLSLIQYGQEQCAPYHLYGPATRNHYLFHYILSGKGILYSTDSRGGNHTYHLSQGSGFLICPNQINTYIADGEDPWRYIWLEFDGLKCQDILASTGLSFDSPIYRANDKALCEEMVQEMFAVVNGSQNQSLYLIAHLYLFLDLLVRSSFSRREFTAGKLRDLYIREAVTFIEQNYYRSSITVEDIAHFCNLNQSYLGKIFKESMNQTLQQFLIYYRMNKAAEFLKNSSMPVGEIAKVVGYPNQLNFSRAFKNVYGLSPQNWRRENQLITSIPKKKTTQNEH